jgi:hypothetical protein
LSVNQCSSQSIFLTDDTVKGTFSNRLLIPNSGCKYVVVK